MGLVLLLAVGVLGAFVVNRTATSQTEANVQPIILPGPQPTVVQTTRIVPGETPKPAVAAAAVTPAAPTPPAAAPATEPVDARWQGNLPAVATPSQNPLLAATPPELAPTASALVAPEAAAGVPVASPDGTDDGVVTAAIVAPDQPVPVPTAAPRRERAAEQPQAKAKQADQNVKRGQIRTAVNMRASGSDKAKIIDVVPANAHVEVVGCKSWCEIVYKDKRGWIYKSFLR